jgi:hypothetical protein
VGGQPVKVVQGRRGVDAGGEAEETEGSTRKVGRSPRKEVSGSPMGTSQDGEGLRWRSLERLPTVSCLMVRPLKAISVPTTRNNELLRLDQPSAPSTTWMRDVSGET